MANAKVCKLKSSDVINKLAFLVSAANHIIIMFSPASVWLAETNFARGTGVIVTDDVTIQCFIAVLVKS